MCGIIGIITVLGAFNEPLGSIIKKCLKNLEYRGYDSVGFAILGDVFVVRKSKGKIDDVAFGLGFDKYDGFVGIGHTRWATHGPPVDKNAHPHVDCLGRVAVVHNGVLENYLELKEVLKEKGHIFRSDTDTEVIPHLIEEFKKRGFQPYEAFKKAISVLKGAYAVVAIDLDEPNKLFFARNTSPLIIGIGRNTIFLASDIPAFLEYTNRVIVLEDGELGYATSSGILIEKLLKPGKLDNEPAMTDIVDYKQRIKVLDWTPEMAKKGGYPHFMLKEIHEQPGALAATIAGLREEIDGIVDALLKSDKVVFVAAGTSYHASLLGALYMNNLAEKWSMAFISSEARWWMRNIGERDVVIAVSQSGETIDTLVAVREAKRNGAKVLAVSNIIDSAIPRESDFVVYTKAGPEIGVAATKTFTTQVAVLLYLSIKVAERIGNKRIIEEIKNDLARVPELASSVLSRYEARIKSLSRIFKKKTNAFYLGRGFGVPIAMEGALKMKEIAYIHAEAYPAGESKHGPIALVEKDFPVVFTSIGEEEELLQSNIEEMRARGAWIITIARKGSRLFNISDERFAMPNANEYVMPILSILPLQMLAYYTAVARGYDPDKPRNLAKTVTVV